MSADLHLYVLPAHLKDDFLAWQSVQDVHRAALREAGLPGLEVLSSKDWTEEQAQSFRVASKRVEEQERQLREKVQPWSHEDLWLGQISYMGMTLSGDFNRYIPAPLARIHTLMDERPLRVLTPGLKAAITTAFNLRDESVFNTRRRYYYQTTADDPTGKWCDRAKRNRYGIWFGNGSRGLAKRQDVRRFCQQHLGELVYLESE